MEQTIVKHDVAEDSPSVVTPDFYRYSPAPLSSASLDGSWVIVAWADETTLRCYDHWLTENTPGRGFDQVTRESILDPGGLGAVSKLASAAVDSSGHLSLQWLDGQSGLISSAWLRHIAEIKHKPSSYIPASQTWTSEDFSEPPTTDGTTILTDSEVLRSWLVDLCRYGIARVENGRADRDFLEELATLFGPLRSSNFGTMFTVEAMLDPDSTAYTGLNLGQHTDLPTRESPPGYQFLHCVENSVAGGWSRMTDGEAVAAEIRDNHPAEYEALTTLQWIFFNRASDSDHRWSGSVIEPATRYGPLTLRAFYPVRAFPDMDEKDVERGYDAMALFSKVAHDDRFQIRYPFRAGDVVGFDNRRVLHGRDQFEPSNGKRVLRGTYVDQDDVYSALRLLERDRETPKPRR